MTVHDALKYVTATNRFKKCLNTLYALYSCSPKNQNKLKLHCTSLNEIFLKIGKILYVCSYRTVKAVWKMYPALYKHLTETSEGINRD